MFTGLITELGEALDSPRRRGTGMRLWIRCAAWASGPDPIQLGESIAHNGACLTVAERQGDRYACDLLAETVARTNLGELAPGTLVNLERALRPADRLGGHLVQGHIDGVGTVALLEPAGSDHRLCIQAGPELVRSVVAKGSIAVDGISLTVATVWEGGFDIFVIPHTWRKTNLQFRRRGDRVNLETDLIAKYVRAFLAPYGAEPGVGARLRDALDRAGYLAEDGA